MGPVACPLTRSSSKFSLGLLHLHMHKFSALFVLLLHGDLMDMHGARPRPTVSRESKKLQYKPPFLVVSHRVLGGIRVLGCPEAVGISTAGFSCVFS